MTFLELVTFNLDLKNLFINFLSRDEEKLKFFERQQDLEVCGKIVIGFCPVHETKIIFLMFDRYRDSTKRLLHLDFSA